MRVGLPTAHRELRQAREGATVAGSECGRPSTFCGLPVGLAVAAGLLVALVARPTQAESLRKLLRVLPVIEIALASPDTVDPDHGGAAAEPEPYFPFLAGEDVNQSISVGDTSHGHLVSAVRIDEDETLGILPKQRARGLNHGSQELVGALRHAASALHAATNTRMWIGNVGARGGGDIDYSVSHNSGRDADIAFCYRNHRDEPVDPPDLVALNGQGLATTRPLKLDPARTWIVVKALLTYPTTQVQYLFVANGLKDQLLAAAREAGDSTQLIQLAAAVMRQPIGSAPHNDHLHLRIYCSERDVLGGCVNTGWIHPWTKVHDEPKRRMVDRVIQSLGQVEAEERKRGLERLGLLSARRAAGPIADRLDDDSVRVRKAAAAALATVGRPSDVSALDTRFRREDDEQVKVAIVHAVADLGGAAAGRFLHHAVGEPRPSTAQLWPALSAAASIRGPALLSLLPTLIDTTSGSRIVQLAAVAAAARAERLEPVPRLIALLDDRDPSMRHLSGHALRMATNLGYGVRWAEGDPTHLAKGRQRWTGAWHRSASAPRDAWLITGFRAAGYQIPKLSQRHAWELVRASAGADHLSHNAQRVLMRLFDHHPPTATWRKGDACQYWLRWLKRRRKGYRLAKPPTKTVTACYRPSP